MPVTVIGPDEIPLAGRNQVALLEAWDHPLSLPVDETPDGSLVSAVRLPIHVPTRLDAARHRWQVGLISTSHPPPPLPCLFGEALLASPQDRYETFVRSADGGVSYASHRSDFVPTGASLAGRLAGPRLSWPSIDRILSPAAAPDAVRPSAAGKRARITQRLLGSREAVEELADTDRWPLLSHWLPEHDRAGLPEVGVWKLKSGVVLTWDAIVAAAPDRPQEWLRAQVDAWTACGLLRRGLALGCCDCPALEFYPIGEVAQQYTCRRCGSDNTLEQARWKLP